MKLYLNDLGLLTACGNDKSEFFHRLLQGDRSGLKKTDEFSPGHQVFVGRVDSNLPDIPARLKVYDCRNNQLLLAAYEQIQMTVKQMIEKYGRHRIGTVIGTSTSGVGNTDLALAAVAKGQGRPDWFHYKQQQFGAAADFLAHLSGIGGPAYTVSTACSSSGHALSSARRLIALDLCDAVIVGGADSLCRFTVCGFMSLESVSSGPCKPFGANRDGINLGEGASLFVLSKEPGPVRLDGIGSTTDAYHFSAPDPSGDAVIDAMQIALQQAQLSANDIDYINLHGTATALNDVMESNAIQRLFGSSVAVSSTKGMTGHCLGAAAAIELGICWLLLTDSDGNGRLIANVNDDTFDPKLPALNFVEPQQTLGRNIKNCQSNSFAFGGNNVSVVVSRTC